MKAKKLISVVVLVAVLVPSASAIDQEARRAAVTAYTESEHPEKAFKSDEWYVSAFFIDLDGDGREECLAANPDSSYSDGCAWDLVGLDADSRYMMDFSGIYCRAIYTYRVSLAGVGERLAFRRAYVYHVDGGKIADNSKTNLLVTAREGTRLKAIPLSRGFDELFVNPGFERLQAVEPECFEGFGLKLLKHSSRFDSNSPERWQRPRGGAERPANFEAFVRHYREVVKARLGYAKKNAVHVVFFDVDDDGDTDFYVSSEAERVAGDRYQWTLYLNDKGAFTRAKETVWFNRELDNLSSAFEPEVVATRQAFHRVVYGWRKPAFAVLDVVGRRVRSQSYAKYLTEEERRSRPCEGRMRSDGDMEFDQWNNRVKSRLGGSVPFEFCELFEWLDVRMIERLPCEDFPEY